jgi:hypothetical protein
VIALVSQRAHTLGAVPRQLRIELISPSIDNLSALSVRLGICGPRALAQKGVGALLLLLFSRAAPAMVVGIYAHVVRLKIETTCFAILGTRSLLPIFLRLRGVRFAGAHLSGRK